ncbi:thioredoxin family protein [Winogradskyella alexanderae]|uniref:Thioredoxin fold domain-containing protein n=1 Tax=Winogradskyella alexanderae TaxID=2877123 RepID=A0ABS7XSP6_9FLAO|nr:thioredoxin fold domain-containing protein [Winogradskyella alexanderae]MCA0132479.1 thioredoxin fold domain-containing protein [Winogradskyella alexanderae]
MKKLQYIIAFLVFGTFLSIQNPTEESETTINWITIEEALELQKKEPKKIFMDVYTNWCGPCKMLDKYTFHNPDVVNYVNENYYAVKFDAEGNTTVNFKEYTFGNPNFDPAKVKRRNSVHEFTRFLNVNAYPTMVFLDEDANLLAPISGYLKPQQLELYLKLFKENKHKEMTTQEKFNEYYKSFKPTFKVQ